MGKKFHVLWLSALLLCLLLGLTGCKKTYKLSDYISYEFDGYDGFGTVEASFNVDKFIRDADAKNYKKSIEKIKVKVSKDEELSNGDLIRMTVQVPGGLADSLKANLTDDVLEVEVEGLEEIEEYNAFKNVDLTFEGYDTLGKASMTVDDKYFDAGLYTLDKTEGLSNGDEVTVTLEVPDLEYYIEEYGLIPEEYEKTYTVEGLESVPTRDYFADVTITFEGMNGSGVIRASLNEGAVMGLNEYWVDKSSELKNGDEVVVSLDYEDEYYFETYGYLPMAKEKTYKVEGLGSYVSSLDELSKEAIDDMDAACRDYLTELYTSTGWKSDALTILDQTLIGQYLLEAEGSSTPANMVFMVYAVQAEVEEGSGKTTFYWAMGFNNLTVNENKEVTVDTGSTTKIADSYQSPDVNYICKIDGEEVVGAATEEVLSSLIQDQYISYKFISNADASKAEYHEGGMNKENENKARPVSSSAEITEDVLATLKADAETRIRNREKVDMDAGESLDSVEFVESVFVVGGKDDKPQNVLYLIFKLTATNMNGTFTWYDSFWYSDLTIQKGVVSVDVNTAKGIGDDHYAYDNNRKYYFYYTGYTSLDELREFCKTDLGYAVR